jgi:hypothetical protein
MKRDTLLILLFLCFSITLAGQIRFNPKVGFNLNSISEQDFDIGKVDARAGFQLGLNLRIGDPFYFSSGLHYFQFKNRYLIDSGLDGEEFVEGIDENIAARGLHIPLEVGYDFLKYDTDMAIRVFVAPSVNLMFKEDEIVLENEDVSLRNALFGMGFGVGFDFKFLTFDIKYERGLSNTFSTEGLKGRNNVLFVSAGIIF